LSSLAVLTASFSIDGASPCKRECLLHTALLYIHVEEH